MNGAPYDLLTFVPPVQQSSDSDSSSHGSGKPRTHFSRELNRSSEGGGAPGAGSGRPSRRAISLDLEAVTWTQELAAAAAAAAAGPQRGPSPFAQQLPQQQPELLGQRVDPALGGGGRVERGSSDGGSQHGSGETVHSLGSSSLGATSLPSLRAFHGLAAVAAASPTAAQAGAAQAATGGPGGERPTWPVQVPEGAAAAEQAEAQHRRVVSICPAGLPEVPLQQQQQRVEEQRLGPEGGGGFAFLAGGQPKNLLSWHSAP